MIGGVLLITGLWVYVNVLPLLGDSFTYLQWLNPQSIGGRAPLLQEAWAGFLQHPFGQGIGSFQIIEPLYTYPHNVVLESAYELGILGLLAMLGIYLMVVRRAWQLWLSPPHRMLALLPVTVFLYMLKAGDIAELAFHWVYVYLLVVGTPVAASWPLRRRRAVE
jgi:O-antigen ligase